MSKADDANLAIARMLDTDLGRQELAWMMATPINKATGKPVKEFVPVYKTPQQIKREEEEAKVYAWVHAFAGDPHWQLSDEEAFRIYLKKFGRAHGLPEKDLKDL